MRSCGGREAAELRSACPGLRPGPTSLGMTSWNSESQSKNVKLGMTTVADDGEPHGN